MPHWYSIPKLPVDFILYDNSMWNIPYEETWQKSNAILIDGIPPPNPLSNITDTKDNDDDNDSCGNVKMLKNSCPRKGDWVTKLCDPEKIRKTIDALERCIKKYRNVDTDDAKERLEFSEAQLRYLKKKLVLMQIEEGKNPFELSYSDRQRIDNMTDEEKDASSKEIELLFGPYPLSTCDETKECKEALTPEEEKELKDLEAEAKEEETLTPEQVDNEFGALEAEAEAESAAAAAPKAKAEGIPPELAEPISKFKNLIKRQENSISAGNELIKIHKKYAKKAKNDERKIAEAKIIVFHKNRVKELKKLLEKNKRKLRSLERTARAIVRAQKAKAKATTSIENPVHGGGGKLSRGQLADYRLKHIQKLLNKQKKNKTLKKFNRRLNKTIKLY